MSRERIAIGRSRPQKKHLDAIATAYRRGDLSLIIGAGASIPYGIPSWDELVTGLLLSETGKRFKNFYPHYRTALTSWLGQKFDFSPVTLARVVKYNLRKGRGGERRLREGLQKRLYANYREPRDATPATLLDEIVELVANDPGRIRRIVNLNFDDLLVSKLNGAGVESRARYRPDRKRRGGVTVLHPHGFIPRPPAPVPPHSIVFTEDEYHRVILEPLNWVATELASTLHNSVGLFLGLSMNDPNLRRVLDTTFEGRSRRTAKHYLLRHDYSLAAIDVAAATAEIQRRAAEEFVRRSPNATESERDRYTKKSKSDLENAIKRALRQAHTYDRQLFKDIGVGTVWVQDFADMPKVLEWIRAQVQ